MRNAMQAPHVAGSLLADRYRLVKRVGRGATADVFSAEDERLGRTVAIKLFHHAPDDVEQQRIQLEMRTLAGLRHPGLVAVYDVGYIAEAGWPDDERPFLVMELVEGESLRQCLARGPLPPADVGVIGRSVADALAYVHASGLVHRDVKPANILLGEDAHDARFSVKLADFGIARLSNSPHLTSHGTAVGTASYLSPEQVTGEHVTGTSDVYSLGLVLLECMTGQTAFPGWGVEAALLRLQRDPEIPRHLAPGWRSLITAMTLRASTARPTANEVAVRLNDGIDVGTADTDAFDAPTAAVPLMLPPDSPAHTAVLPLPMIEPEAVAPRRRHVLGYLIAVVSALLLIALVAIAAGSGGLPHVVPPSSVSTPSVSVAPITSPAKASVSSKPAPAHSHHKHKSDAGGGNGQGDG